MDPNLSFFLMMAIIFAIFYFMIIRPQQQRVKKHQDMVNAIRRGDKVLTAGGVLGKVTKVIDEREAMIEIADGVQVRILKQTLSDVVNKGEPATASEKD